MLVTEMICLSRYLIFFYPVGPPSNNTSGVEPTCEPITAVPMCTSALPYSEAQLPNMLGHTNQGSIMGELASLWLPIVFSGCSPYIHTFVCQSYLPSCNPDLPIVPCR